jgi:hypothetical protein
MPSCGSAVRLPCHRRVRRSGGRRRLFAHHPSRLRQPENVAEVRRSPRSASIETVIENEFNWRPINSRSSDAGYSVIETGPDEAIYTVAKIATIVEILTAQGLHPRPHTRTAGLPGAHFPSANARFAEPDHPMLRQCDRCFPAIAFLLTGRA